MVDSFSNLGPCCRRGVALFEEQIIHESLELDHFCAQ
jgi:hypothetical protein